MIEKLKHLKPIPNMMLLAILVLLFILTTQTSAIGQTLCDGKVPTIVGTKGPDEINGTEGPDVIHGLGGNDIIRGLGGDDVICGGNGQDVIGGGYGNDTVLGENGNDSIWGGYGNDTVRGGDGNDSVYGGPGDDNLYGNHGNDTLYGISGVDRLYGGWGTENNDSCYDDPGTFIWGCEQFNGENIPPAPVPWTGSFWDKYGVPWPDPRFTDNGDGTVTDNLTGLIWLKNHDCFGQKKWADAVGVSGKIADGQCGLADGSRPGDWRLPNIKELTSLINYRCQFWGDYGDNGCSYAAGCYWIDEDPHDLDIYYTTTVSDFVNEPPERAHQSVWTVDCTDGSQSPVSDLELHGVWPVRGGN